MRRYAFRALVVWSVLAGTVKVASAHQPPAAATGAPFQLNAIEQAFLDQVLSSWEQESGKVRTFRCEFERWDYNVVFGPRMDVPFSKDKGEVSFSQPDKGSYQITEIHRWQAQAAQPGQQPPKQLQGTWVHQPEAVGEHWVCDGQSVFEYRHDQKQLVVRPIPPEMQGKAIVDGPLPFLFGAEAEKLKTRYWLKVEQQPNPNQIWLQAHPKFQADKANYDWVRLSLERTTLLPAAMEIHLPDGSRHTYIFDMNTVSKNAPFDRLKNLFVAPRTPFGWKRVVETNVAQLNPAPQQPVQR